MARPKSKIDEMSEVEKKNLIQRLWELQGKICFLCEDEINLQADNVEVDHIIPLADNGPDEEANW
ncbi:MAG TPA: HNH endonuclease signature motif containing protein, partial [Candidatus Ratteibacteria bacterium]|nr:HNH endonuclease signature motif containing protein [Candidatus Ratteibacteria bacterium]